MGFRVRKVGPSIPGFTIRAERQEAVFAADSGRTVIGKDQIRESGTTVGQSLWDTDVGQD